MLDFRLVAEALQERGLLIQKLAPHLIKPVPFVYPLQRRGWERLYAGSGVALYDTLGLLSGRARGVPHHRHLTRRGARRIVPALKKDALVGALQYYDAQVDDARHTMFIARTAAAYGAHVASRARVVGLLKEGERVVGAQVHDLESGRVFDVRARQVVNATGVWTDETQALAGERGQFHVRASKGIHLVVPRDRIRSDSGLILRTEKSVLFVIPWGRHWIIGTTDTDWALDLAHPAASAADIQYLLDHVNAVIAPALTHEDVEGVYAGLRPLLSGESESTSKLSREHAVAHTVPGLVVIAGGKYTTYRVMAKDAIDAAVNALETVNGKKVPKSVTDDVPLLGAEGYHALWNARSQLARRSGLHEARIEHLLNRYGSLVHEVLELIEDDPTLREPLAGAPTTCAPRRCTRLHTKAPGTSTTCWPAAPASRSRRSTAGSGRPRRWPGSSRRCSGGATSRWRGRSSTTSSGWRPSARASGCRTTRRRTRRGWGRRRSCRCAERPEARTARVERPVAARKAHHARHAQPSLAAAMVRFHDAVVARDRSSDLSPECRCRATLPAMTALPSQPQRLLTVADYLALPEDADGVVTSCRRATS